MTKKTTIRESRARRDEREHAKITRIYNNAKRLKRCPVCGGPQGHGITCGQIACIRTWLFPTKGYIHQQQEEDNNDLPEM